MFDFKLDKLEGYTFQGNKDSEIITIGIDSNKIAFHDEELTTFFRERCEGMSINLPVKALENALKVYAILKQGDLD